MEAAGAAAGDPTAGSWGCAADLELVPTGRQCDGRRIEAGGAAFIGMAADAAIKVQVPGTQAEPDKQHDQQQRKNWRLDSWRRRLGSFHPLFYCGTGGWLGTTQVMSP